MSVDTKSESQVYSCIVSIAAHSLAIIEYKQLRLFNYRSWYSLVVYFVSSLSPDMEYGVIDTGFFMISAEPVALNLFYEC